MEQNQRLDKFLQKYLNTAPKSFVFKMLRKKNIKVNDKRCDGNYILQEDDIVNIYLSDETIAKFKEEKVIEKANKIDVVFEDENILVVNKPAGVLSHSTTSDDKDTINHRILYYLKEKGELEEFFVPSICNRLDINTSGLIIAGKNLPSVQALNECFKLNKIDKYYITLVKGEVKKSGTIKSFYEKNSKENIGKSFNTYKKGRKEIITKYDVVNSNKDYSVLKVKLITGKSHQIRLHLSSIGHFVVGDRKYGDENVNTYFRKKYSLANQFLHSESLVFKMNEGYLKYLYNTEISCSLPKKLNSIIKDLKL